MTNRVAFETASLLGLSLHQILVQALLKTWPQLKCCLPACAQLNYQQGVGKSNRDG